MRDATASRPSSATTAGSSAAHTPGDAEGDALRPAVDASGRLRIAAAVGTGSDVAARAGRLLEIGVDMLVVDTAHGHQDRMVEALRDVRALAPAVPVVAGNVATAQGVHDLVDAGADIVKSASAPARCARRE